MSEPKYSVTTERIYNRLPEAYRTLDSQNDWQFKKYISSIGDQLNDIDLLVARFQFVPPDERVDYYASLNEFNTYERPAGIEDPNIGFAPIAETCDLLDARTADPAWFPFIAQLVGADLSTLSDDDEKQDALANNYLGFRVGSRASVEDAVKRVLTGTKYSRVYPHRDGAGGSISSPGTQWDILIVTKEVETPIGIDIVDEVTKKGVKPAGVVLHHISYNIVWSIIESVFDTWDKIDATLSWSNFETANAEELPLS
jgi:hypothetical protein